ncbi:MAG: hypothetical protein ABI395_10080 [Sphingobium sp.]
MSTVEILRYNTEEIPVFFGRYENKPITIRLDFSARLKLEGDCPEARLLLDASLLSRIADCATRIINLERQVHTQLEEITISAVDLD